MIEVRHLSKAYPVRRGMHQVLDDISITFPAGENIGILGRNGQGKSTLLRILANIEQPDSGEVIRRQRVSWPIGFAGGFSASLTGEENTRFVARIYGADIDEVSEFALEFSMFKAAHADRLAKVMTHTELSEGDLQFRWWNHMMVFLHAETYFHHRELGLMPPSHWDGYVRYVDGYLGTPGVGEFWADVGPAFSRGFAGWVDKLLAQRSKAAV